MERFGELFQQACRRCLVSDVPVALLLSDGIDSNAVRSSLQATGVTMSSYTFRLNSSGPSSTRPHVPAGHDDGSVHLRMFDPRGVHEQIDPALSSLTEPIGDGSAIATWLLIRGARPEATVFLCGHGGDEVLCGYHLSQHRFRLVLARIASRLPFFLAKHAVEYWTHGVKPLKERHRAFRRSSRHDWPAAIPYLIQRPLDPSDVQQLTGRPVDADRHLASITGLYDECPANLTDLDRMQYVLLETFFAANILSFADAVSMDSSAELRMPFVDRDLLEFALELPRWMRASRWPGRANTKLVLRQWAEGNLPEEVISRKKRSFRYGSIRYLLRDHGDMVRSRILDQPFLRHSLPGVEAWLDQDVEFFHGSREGTLWALLSLAVWGNAAGLH